jgi:hypothetical protein
VRVHRVFPHRPGAEPGEPGHASYLPTVQGGGRLDNPEAYVMRYFGETAAAAVAERFGELDEWVAPMLRLRDGSRLALATFDLTNEARLLDMDDAQVLVDRGLRPTQVVRRDLAVTQAWAMKVYDERTSPRGRRRWDGIRWWSWHRPEWPVLGIWAGEPELVDVQVLDLRHPAVQEAATLLGRPLPRS